MGSTGLLEVAWFQCFGFEASGAPVLGLLDSGGILGLRQCLCIKCCRIFWVKSFDLGFCTRTVRNCRPERNMIKLRPSNTIFPAVFLRHMIAAISDLCQHIIRSLRHV